MESLGDLLSGISSILWPILLLVVLLRLTPSIRGIIESAKSRGFTLKIGGQELTMDEFSEQNQNMIADLQTQLVTLRQAMSASGDVSASPAVQADYVPPPVRPAVLWVDDQPKNNSYFIQQLLDSGIQVDLALSTIEGLKYFERNEYRVVISDIGRSEDGMYKPRAGLDILKSIRQANPQIPIVLYTSSRGVREHLDEATQLGAMLVTSSPTEMTDMFRKAFPEWRA